MRRDAASVILVCAVLALIIGPLGTAVFVLGFALGDSPCILCWAQRTGIVLVALCGLFVLRYGPRPKYIGLGVVIAAWGLHMGVRHSALHVARDVGQGFSIELFGAHTYIWSTFIFWVSVLLMGVLLMLLRDGDTGRAIRTPTTTERVAMWLFLVVVGANAAQALMSTGPPPFIGQSDPVRFSFNPRHWVWSLDEWGPAPISLRGAWGIEAPHVPGHPTAPDAGPLAGTTALNTLKRFVPALGIEDRVSGLAYDTAADRFLVTTAQGIYITDGTLRQVLRHTVVDPEFSVDLADFAGGAFLDARTLIAVSRNKSFVILEDGPSPDRERRFRFFLESPDAFNEVTRSRFATVRARMMYVMSAAYDPASQSIFTITVPNARVQRVVVSRFDRRDLTLSEEFLLTIAPQSGLALRPERALDEYYVTGATFHEGRLLALSAAYNTLLSIDPISHRVTAAQTIAELDRPVGIAVRGNELYVAGEDGSVAVVGLGS